MQPSLIRRLLVPLVCVLLLSYWLLVPSPAVVDNTDQTLTSDLPTVGTPLLRRPASPPAAGHPPSPDCGLTFLRYTPSTLETEWNKRVSPPFDVAKEGLCALLLREAARWMPPLQAVLTAALTVQQSAQNWVVPGAPTPVEVSSAVAAFAGAHPSSLSALVYRDGCSGAEVTAHVPPLAALMRDPRPVCARGAERTDWAAHGLLPAAVNLQRKDFVLLDPGYLSAVHASLHPGRRAFLFDAGAGFWGSTEMSSLPWLLAEFSKFGVSFDHVFAWEMTPHPGSEFFKGMPAEVVARTSFYNFPVQSEVGHPANPFTVMKEVARPGDFVVFKLDVDFPAVELPLVEQLRTDASLQELVDVFFFEHHVVNQDMARFWLKEVAGTFLTSAALFTDLRVKGVNAQVWP